MQLLWILTAAMALALLLDFMRRRGVHMAVALTLAAAAAMFAPALTLTWSPHYLKIYGTESSQPEGPPMSEKIVYDNSTLDAIDQVTGSFRRQLYEYAETQARSHGRSVVTRQDVAEALTKMPYTIELDD